MADIDKIIEVVGFVMGLFYLYWEYKADAKMWIASMISPAIGMVLYFSKGIYADSAMNIYYMLIGIYGYWNWTRKRGTTKKTLPISRVPMRTAAVLALVMLALWAFISQILINFTDSTIPYLDAFTTAMAIVASWMGAKKYCEQWLLWIVIDAVTVPMQIYKGLIFYPILFSIYTIVAVFGYRNWLRMMKQQ